jgi:hypothetical protein
MNVFVPDGNRFTRFGSQCACASVPFAVVTEFCIGKRSPKLGVLIGPGISEPAEMLVFGKI